MSGITSQMLAKCLDEAFESNNWGDLDLWDLKAIAYPDFYDHEEFSEDLEDVLEDVVKQLNKHISPEFTVLLEACMKAISVIEHIPCDGYRVEKYDLIESLKDAIVKATP